MSNNTKTTGAHAVLAAVAVAMLAVAVLGAVAAPAAAVGDIAPQTDGNETATETNETTTETAPDEPAEEANETTTPEVDTDPGLTLQELRAPGAQMENAPAGVRGLGPEGAVAIQHSPIDPLSPDDVWLEPGTEINSNTLVLKSTRFGPSVEPVEVTVHTAFYKTAEREVQNNDGETVTTEEIATDVHTQEHDATLGTRYDNSEISLTPHFDESYEMAIWVTDADGNQLGDARWSDGLSHRSSQAAEAVDIDNQSDLWGFIFKNIIGIGVVGLLAGMGSGKHVLDQIGRGTGLGLAAYGMLFAAIAFVLVAFLYIETAAIIANVPMIWGVLIAIIGFIGYVETAGADDRRVLFEKDELTEAKSASGEEVVDSVYEDVSEKLAIYREDGSIGLPKNGIRPAIARYFAKPALLDDIDLSTSVDVRGDFDEKYIADPDSEYVIDHTAAHLEWDPEVIAPVVDERNPAGLLDRINWSFVVGAMVLVGGGWYAADAVLGFGIVGVIGGLLGVGVMGHKARDGHAEFEPAPIHMRPAKATVKNTAIEYDDAKTIEEADRQLYVATATSAAEVRRRQAEQSRVTSRQLMEESTGVSLDPDEETPGSTPVERPDGRAERRNNGHDDSGEDDDDDMEWNDG